MKKEKKKKLGSTEITDKLLEIEFHIILIYSQTDIWFLMADPSI